ncbi:hypothetical protein D3C80_957220 [compost metagenome]
MRGFIVATDLQVLGQVAFALGDAFQAAGHAADRAHDEAGKTGADDGEDDGQGGGDDGDQPGQLGRGAHHVVLFDQADEGPAQLFRRPDVGHVVLAVQLHFHQALAGLGQLRVAVAKGAQRFEVVFRLFRVHQDHAGVFQQHQVAGFTELDLFDDFGELLERHVDADHAAVGAQLVVDGAHGADIGRVILGPVVGLGAKRLARFGLGGLVPGALARVVVVQLRIIRPRHIAARRRAEDGIGVGRVAVAQILEQGEDFFVSLPLRDAFGVGGHVSLEAVVGVSDQRLLGQVIDVLADAVKEQLHGVADLTNLAGTAVDEFVPGITAQVQHNEGGDQHHGQAGDDCKRPGQLLFDVHPRSRFSCRPTQCR